MCKKINYLKPTWLGFLFFFFFAFLNTEIAHSQTTTFDFYFSIDPVSGQIMPGEEYKTFLTFNLSSGESRDVSFIIPKIPNDITVTLSQSSCRIPCSIIATISALKSALPNFYTIPFMASGGGITRTNNFVMQVLSPPTFDFSFELSHLTKTIKPQESASFIATIAAISGTPQNVSFLITNTPTTISTAFVPANCTPPCSSAITFTTTNITPTDEYDIEILGAAVNVVRKKNFKLIVASDIGSPPLIYPVDKSKITTLTPLFDWANVEGTKSYVIQIGSYKSSAKTSKFATASGILKYGHTYSWRVKSCKDEAGLNCGLWSEPLQFTIQKKTSTKKELEAKIALILQQIALLQDELNRITKK